MLRLELEQVRSLEGMITALDGRIAQLMEEADKAKAREEAEKVKEKQSEAKEPKQFKKKAAPKPVVPFLAAIRVLTAIPGIKQRNAENILAEIGTNMGQFETERHISSWGAMCPGNNISAGRSKSGRTNQGNTWLKRALCQAAWGASRAKKSCLSAMFHRLVRRRGAQRTIVAVGHSILVSIYHMLKNNVEYKDLGPDYYTQQNKSNERKLIKQLERLGYKVTSATAA